MKKKKPHDKLRHKNKIRKNQTAALQKDDRIRDDSLDKMERRISEMTGVEHKIIRDKSFASMSEALIEFAQPLLDVIDLRDREAYEKAVLTAICFWNCAVMQQEPGNDRKIKKLLKPFMKDADGKAIATHMLDRKRLLFPDLNRYIVNYELVDQGDDYHLSVASTFGDFSPCQ